jgi:formylglycine-generating enzyme required for sulfatase activity
MHYDSGRFGVNQDARLCCFDCHAAGGAGVSGDELKRLFEQMVREAGLSGPAYWLRGRWFACLDPWTAQRVKTLTDEAARSGKVPPPSPAPWFFATFPQNRPVVSPKSPVRGEKKPAKFCPLWDGQEFVHEYAKMTGLEARKTLDFGNGVKLEVVLIPAGKFTMGTESGTAKPTPVNEEGFRRRIKDDLPRQIFLGQIVLAFSLGALSALLVVIVARAVRERHRPQFSLGFFVFMIMVAGVGVLGGTHWWYSAQKLSQTPEEYQAALTALALYEKGGPEKPAHKVTISAPFWMGKFEVTQEQYQQVMGANPSHFRGAGLPVETVSWEKANEFLKKAGEMTGSALRLPSEAEWEWACRAGTRSEYCSGDGEANLKDVGWYKANSGDATHPVGQKRPNAWGLYDMHGNVWEWCADWYESYSESAAVDPQGPAQGGYRVERGGSYSHDPLLCRSAYRFRCEPTACFEFIGFRVAVSLPTPP